MVWRRLLCRKNQVKQEEEKLDEEGCPVLLNFAVITVVNGKVTDLPQF